MNIEEQFDVEIQYLVTELNGSQMDPSTYERKVDSLNKLIYAKKEYLETLPKSRIKRLLENREFISTVGKLLGIGMIINHERIHVITTRAIGMIRF